jgi:putative membrane protein
VYDPYASRPPPRVWPYVLFSAVVITVVVVFTLLYFDSVGAFGGYHTDRPGGAFYYGFFPVLLVLILVLFVVRIAFWSRRTGYRGYRNGPRRLYRDPAVMTVRQRFARGEITREQYDQLMTDLMRRRSGP